MNSVIVGIFDTQAAANEAKNQLLVAGFANHAVVVSDEDMATMRSDSVVGSTAVQPRHEPERDGKARCPGRSARQGGERITRTEEGGPEQDRRPDQPP